MRLTSSLLTFKKHSKLLRLSRLYLDLLKTKHLLTFFMGGLKGYQLKKLYQTVSKHQHFLNFLISLECRLELILLKVGFVLTGKQARQFILHNHVLLNGFPVTAYNYQLKCLDTLSFRKSFVKSSKPWFIYNLWGTPPFFNFLKKKRLFKKTTIRSIFAYAKFPHFLEANFRTCTVCLVRKPLTHECTFTQVLSLYDCNQLYMVL